KCFRIRLSECGRVAQLGEHLLCKRETKFARTCRSRRKPLKSSKLQQKRASRFFVFLLFVRFPFEICRDLSRLVLRFYYVRALASCTKDAPSVTVRKINPPATEMHIECVA